MDNETGDFHKTAEEIVSAVFAASGPTPPSTWSSKPSESSKPKPSAKIRGLIGRLGLRYHPTNSTDLAAHQAMLQLLAEDLAHMPPDALERAIDRHVVTSPYMPKAADLIKLAQSESRPGTIPRNPGRSYAEDLAASYNAKRKRTDVVWIVAPSGEVKLVDCPDWQADHTKHLERTAEDERQRMQTRRTYPVTEAAE